MPQLPSPLRAAIGLVATAMDEARHLPDKAIELPMLAVSTALQLSLRAQQRYAHLTARGDELLNRREPTDEPPPWATFDEPVGVTQLDLARDPEHTAVDTGAAQQPKPKPKPRAPSKTVRKPRNAKPSAFDAIGDE
jgi:hypothetical protein